MLLPGPADGRKDSWSFRVHGFRCLYFHEPWSYEGHPLQAISAC